VGSFSLASFPLQVSLPTPQNQRFQLECSLMSDAHFQVLSLGQGDTGDKTRTSQLDGWYFKSWSFLIYLLLFTFKSPQMAAS
jgi:hypothetical protein